MSETLLVLIDPLLEYFLTIILNGVAVQLNLLLSIIWYSSEYAIIHTSLLNFDSTLQKVIPHHHV